MTREIKKGPGNKLIKNIVSMFTGSFASKLLTFFLVPLYTSVLSTTEYGISDLIFTTVTLLMPVFTLTIYEPMLRFALDNGSDKNKIFQSGMVVALSGFIILLFLSPLLFLVESIRPLYFLCILYYFSTILYQCLSYYIRGIGKVNIFTIGGVSHTIFLIGLNILFLLVLKFGIVGYLLAYSISSLLSCVVIFFWGKLWIYCHPWRKPDWHYIKGMIRYSVPLIPNAVSWWVSNSSDRYMLTLINGVSVSGIYAVSYKIPSIIHTLSYIVNAAWQLSSVEEFGSESSKRKYEDINDKLFSTLAIGTSVIILFTRVFAQLLYKNEFYSAWKYVPVLAITVIFSSMCGFFETVFKAAKNTKQLFFTTLIGAISNIILNIPLILFWGAYGAAIATLISYIIVYIMRVTQSKRIFDFDIHLKKFVISIALLFGEALLISLNINIATYLAGVILILEVLINHKLILDFKNLVLHYIKHDR